MFKLYRSYIKDKAISFVKYKLISLIKDIVIRHTNEKLRYSERKHEWENKKNTSKLIPDDKFEKHRQGQISWSAEQWRVNHYKLETALEILKIVENL